MEIQALCITCQHLHQHTNREICELQIKILELEQEILDLKMEIVIYRSLYKVWKSFALLIT